MNVPFVTGDKDMDAKFVKEAKAAGLVNLKGPQNCRRYACKYLQCNAKRRRRSPCCIHEKIRGGKCIMFQYKCLNPISQTGLGLFGEDVQTDRRIK